MTITFGFYNIIGWFFFVCKLIYFSYPVQSFGALSAISATFSSLFREVRFRKAPRGAIDVIQFKHFYKTHYKELGKKLWNLHFFIFKGFTHAHAIIFQTKSITIILHFNCTNKCKYEEIQIIFNRNNLELLNLAGKIFNTSRINIWDFPVQIQKSKLKIWVSLRSYTVLKLGHSFWVI